LRDLDTGDLVISTENVLTNSYTYNYLGSDKKYRWNVVAFDSTGKGGWSADPVYFTVKAGLVQPTRTVTSLTQDELSLCPEGVTCDGYTYQVIGIESDNTLQSSFSEFNEGVEDELYIAGGTVVIGKVAVTSAKALTPYISPLIEKAAGTKIGAMVLGSKFVPYLGQAIVVGGVGVATADSANLLVNCSKPSGTLSTDLLFGWEKPSWYFCGRSAVRVPVVAATLKPLSGFSSTLASEYAIYKKGVAKIVNFSALKPANLGSSATQEVWSSTLSAGQSYKLPQNLVEGLAMEEILANPNLYKSVFIQSLSDPRWLGWSKLSYSRDIVDYGLTYRIEIHFNAKIVNGTIEAIDDFKFIVK
jgi:hypothetical protein